MYVCLPGNEKNGLKAFNHCISILFIKAKEGVKIVTILLGEDSNSTMNTMMVVERFCEVIISIVPSWCRWKFRLLG